LKEIERKRYYKGKVAEEIWDIENIRKYDAKI
jgi:hypothetical protein